MVPFLLLTIATPGLCQTELPDKGYGDICNLQQQPPQNQDIISQTGHPTIRSKRPLPVTTTATATGTDGSTAYSFHRDYIVLVYDAEKHKSAFYDYDSHHDEYSPVPNNGAFLPVLYTKEKFLVRVCNLHPTDTVSIAGNSFTLPEQGADIQRNFTAHHRPPRSRPLSIPSAAPAPPDRPSTPPA